MIERFEIKNDRLRVGVKRKGAELCSVIDQETDVEYLWQAEDPWNRHAPLLFPVVGSLLDHQYIYRGEHYPMSHHGFARDMDFEPLQQSEHSLAMLLRSNPETFKVYPFHFSLIVTYTLEENKVIQKFRLINEGEESMPFSVGGHPAFNAAPITDYHIHFEQAEESLTATLEGPYIGKESRRVIEGNRIVLDRNSFDKDAWVFEGLSSKWVELRSKDDRYIVRVSIEDWPYLGIWAKPGADFVCIEPWLGLADLVGHNKQILEKKGIQMLEGKGAFKSAFSMEFSS